MLENKLFIVADDLGLHPRINDGIILGLKKGWISAASIMVNGEGFFDAIKKIDGRPCLGIHLVLVEEKPLALKKFSKNHKTFLIKYLLGLIAPNDIEKELRSQITLCVNSGIRPTFINSHQHLHLLPKITDIVIRLAKENNINYIRTVVEPFSFKAGVFRALQLLVLRILSVVAKNKIKKAGFRTARTFIGFLNAGNLSKEDINYAQEVLAADPNETVEVGCHPGYTNLDLRKKYQNWGNYHWEEELLLLKNFSS